MSVDEVRRRSRWMFRALEWDDPRARYPNIWHEGMPRQILAYETAASRMRLGDLVAIFHPTSQKHAQRSDRFLGIGRVIALRRAAHDPTFAWVDLEVAHRFASPLDLGEAPRRVLLCCDAGWPDREVALFRRVFEAAVREGWRPAPDETEQGAPPRRPAREAAGGEPGSGGDVEGGAGTPPGAGSGAEPPAPAGAVAARLFAGADLGGDMRDPRTGTWLARVELRGDRLRAVRLDATGRTGFQAILRDADRGLLRAEAIGLDFPFGLPLAFAEALLGGPFPEEGWWALAKRLDGMSRPDYLVALEEFRAAHGEMKRLTDETAGLPSPLHRRHPDLGAVAYHGIRMIAEERSRYAVRPFERARGRRLLEVSPEACLRRLGLEGRPVPAVLDALAGLAWLPLDVPEPLRSRCLGSRDALEALVAARCAAAAVVSGEADREPGQLGPEERDRVRREGWIYGLPEPA
jgi:hypothetical protein